MKPIVDMNNIALNKSSRDVVDGFFKKMIFAGLAILLTACAQGSGDSGESNDGTNNSIPVDPPRQMAWIPPTNYTDGSLLNPIKYRIYYGGSESGIESIMEIPNVGSSYDFTPSDRNFLKTRMDKNTKHFFAISVVDNNGIESSPSVAVFYDGT